MSEEIIVLMIGQRWRYKGDKVNFPREVEVVRQKQMDGYPDVILLKTLLSGHEGYVGGLHNINLIKNFQNDWDLIK